MSEPVLAHEVETNLAEHDGLRLEIARLSRRLAERRADCTPSRLSRDLGVLRSHLELHFEHEELSWSALGERLGDRQFLEWAALFTAQHRDFEQRSSELIAALAESAAGGLALGDDLALRLQRLLEELSAHEAGERHLLARQGGCEL